MTGTSATIFGCLGTSLLPDEAAFFRDADPFGFILFARNVENPVQLRALTSDLRAAVGRDAPILIDQEGGRVQRLRAPHWREWQPPLDMVARTRDPARAMWLRARIIAHELRGVGIDANCAPCADVITEATHPFLKNRCYGSDPAQVALLAQAVAAGHLAVGVLPVMKHLPGHGRANADTHHDLPQVDASRDTLRRTDFLPFTALNHLPMAMTAHVVFSAYDSLPATHSATMIGVIRDQIGFGGLLMTDDLNMQALSGSIASRTAASMAAGCDIALHCNGDMAQMRDVAAHAGDQSPATRARARAALVLRDAPPDPVDIAALDAEFRGLMTGKLHG